MSISSSIRKAGPYACNGAAAAFPFSFKVFQASDVLVVQTDLSGVETTKALATDYTVTLNANQDSNPGGTVTMNLAPVNGYLLTIGSQVTYTQGMVLTNTGGFFPQVINDMADRVVILVQQLYEKLSRALTLPFSASSGVSTQLPSPVAGKVIGWRADGLGLDNYDPGSAAGMFVNKTATSGSAILPGGPTANRDAAPGQGYFRFNSNTDQLEWFNGTAWISVTDATTAFTQAAADARYLQQVNNTAGLVETFGAVGGALDRRYSDITNLTGMTYNGAAINAEWITLNNTAWSGSAFAGRDVTGPCFAEAMTDSGQKLFYFAASAAAGAAPAWTLVFALDMTSGYDTIVKPGTIINFAGTSAPAGYLACSTAQTNISRTAYAALFAAIGTTWGAGDGSTTFGMPWFPADYATVQANANVGTSSVGVVLAHTHNVPIAGGGSNTNGTGNTRATGAEITTDVQTPAGGTANLAAGVRVLKCVKY